MLQILSHSPVTKNRTSPIPSPRLRPQQGRTAGRGAQGRGPRGARPGPWSCRGLRPDGTAPRRLVEPPQRCGEHHLKTKVRNYHVLSASNEWSPGQICHAGVQSEVCVSDAVTYPKNHCLTQPNAAADPKSFYMNASRASSVSGSILPRSIVQ